ncbi:hypothetical protein PPL_06495 [Heterostelium album PN500]|uniref:DUF6314 domain-containing protein n=1 Tax=Heterostelium pallidum (strain ATCC 26659 / Pp 5 / PN500) TaxID=670386 RepID=D3BDB2_HETP5|nr:hypothetical protein PPL_06495 [Heterostelium album PN500]EFA80556.1 hypothetical protein PPL_06495 [Heterostelium album PN500]|eukprot:XP_020432676.1 hypothetical protein PPL_06495 [Heterostelium album PN500]
MLKLFQSFIGRWSFHRDISHFAQTNQTFVNPFLSSTTVTPTSCNISSQFQNSGSSSSNNLLMNNSLLEEKMTVDGFATFTQDSVDSQSSSSKTTTTTTPSSTTSTTIDDDKIVQPLRYEEKGLLFKEDGTSCPVTQRYIYCYEHEKINVYFDGNPPTRLLHSLDFVNSALATGHHWCPPDNYDATYEFVSSSEFKLTYCVQGPKKNYRMITTFKRAATTD